MSDLILTVVQFVLSLSVYIYLYIFHIYFSWSSGFAKIFKMFSLELPHGGDSNEYTQYTTFNIQKKITLNYPKSAVLGFFPRDSRMSLKQPL